MKRTHATSAATDRSEHQNPADGTDDVHWAERAKRLLAHPAATAPTSDSSETSDDASTSDETVDEPAGDPDESDGDKPKRGDTAGWKPIFQAIYERHNPSKLPGLDDLMRKYCGRERLWHKTLIELYEAEAGTG